MNRIDQLPEVTKQALGGLTAGDDLKHRVLAEAANQKVRPGYSFLRPAVGLVSAVAVMTAFLLILNLNQPQTESIESIPVLRSFSAGSFSSSPGPLPAFSPDLNVVSIETPYSDTAITDHSEIDSLVSALRDAQVAVGQTGMSFSGVMVFHLSNGTECKYSLDDPFLSSEGKVWKCPGLFTLMKDLSGQ